MFQNIGYIIRNMFFEKIDMWSIPDITIFKYMINLPFTFNPFPLNEMHKTPSYTFLMTSWCMGLLAHNNQITFG